MRAAALRIYHALPASLQSAAAGLHGWRLSRWRYGPESDALVAQALERDSWSPARWAEWRADSLGLLLERAATRVPYYQAAWSARRRAGDHASPTLLENWPVLEKESLRASPRAFLADDCSPRRMYQEHTSGTSGTPLTLWWSRATVRRWYALFEARARRWHGVSRTDAWAIIGGQPVVPASRRTPPFGVWNGALRQLYLSAYHIGAESVSWYVAELSRRRIAYVLGYPSALDALARQILDHGLASPRLAVVITNAEPLYRFQRERIEAAFGCPVRETYGMAEIVAAASECDAGRMHLWPEVGVTEVEEARAAGAGAPLICTGLLNPDMPLIRYQVGDDALLGASRCECGRSLPVIDSLTGRHDDVLRTADGRSIGRLDPVFKRELRIREAQIVQEELTRIRVRVVPAPGFGPDDRRAISDGLRLRMGDVRVEFEELAALPRSANGKLRAVISNLPRPSGAP